MWVSTILPARPDGTTVRACQHHLLWVFALPCFEATAKTTYPRHSHARFADQLVWFGGSLGAAYLPDMECLGTATPTKERWFLSWQDPVDVEKLGQSESKNLLPSSEVREARTGWGGGQVDVEDGRDRPGYG